MGAPLVTRLRYIRAVDPDELTAFVGRLKHRIQIYSMVHDGTAWFLWFVPPDDREEDTPNVDLEA
jgi:hypothetical protein